MPKGQGNLWERVWRDFKSQRNIFYETVSSISVREVASMNPQQYGYLTIMLMPASFDMPTWIVKIPHGPTPDEKCPVVSVC